MPPDVLKIAEFATRGGGQTKLIDTVGVEEEATHAHVPQRVTVLPVGLMSADLLHLVREVTGPNGTAGAAGFKVLVFFTTARLCQLYSELFVQVRPAMISSRSPRALPRSPTFSSCPPLCLARLAQLGFTTLLEMHSRKSQPHRTRVADQFRDGSNLIMFSSDVSARGMDYPDVTAVVQVGMPSDKAQYIHRLGRTARAGKAGGGYLLLADYEAGCLNGMSDLPLEQVISHDLP